MGRSGSVLGRLAAEALREGGREALVGRLDRHVDELAQSGHEQLRLGSLLAVLAPQRQRQTDDDVLGLELGDEPHDLGKAGELLIKAVVMVRNGKTEAEVTPVVNKAVTYANNGSIQLKNASTLIRKVGR